MRTTSFASLSLFTMLAVGCAADDAVPTVSEAEVAAARAASDEDESVTVAFYGLTLIDCQDEATTCLERQGDRCVARLSDCLTDVSLQISKTKLANVGDTVQCGTTGLTCLREVDDVQGAVACQETLENCVIDRVDTASGVKLPHSRRILEAIEALVGTATDVIEPVIGAAANVVGATVDAAGKVIGKTVGTTGKVAAAALDATGHVIATTANVAGDLVGSGVKAADVVAGAAADAVGGAVRATGAVVDHVLDLGECSVISSRCWRETRDFPACQDAYRACIEN